MLCIRVGDFCLPSSITFHACWWTRLSFTGRYTVALTITCSDWMFIVSVNCFSCSMYYLSYYMGFSFWWKPSQFHLWSILAASKLTKFGFMWLTGLLADQDSQLSVLFFKALLIIFASVVNKHVWCYDTNEKVKEMPAGCQVCDCSISVQPLHRT